MKLAEALIMRAELQNRMEQLRERLNLNARVQEGEKPAEEPEKLLKELEGCAEQLEELIGEINLCNARSSINGRSLTQLLARREVLTKRISIMRSFLDAASSTVMRGSRQEVKIYSSVPVAQLRADCDALSKELRQLDISIQAANWQTEL